MRAVSSVERTESGRGECCRARKSKFCWSLSAVLCLILALCSVTHGLYESASNSDDEHHHSVQPSHGEPVLPVDNGDRLSWEYLMKKYSASGTLLSGGEVRKMVRSMQKCDKMAATSQRQLANAAGQSADDWKRRNETQISSCINIINSITVGNNKNEIYYNESSFAKVSKRLFYYVDNPQCCFAEWNESSLFSKGGGELEASASEPDNSHFVPSVQDSKTISKKEKPSSGEVWGYGFLLVTIISCSSLVGVSLMPFMAKEFYKHLLTVMIGLAVGSLTGSAIFHLIPQALRLEEHDPNRNYLHISMVVAGGIWLFFMLERVLKFIMDYKDRKSKSWKREKMSSVLSSTPESSTIAVMSENGNLMKNSLVSEANGEQTNSLIFSSMPRDADVIFQCQEQAIKASFGHQEKPRLSNSHDHHRVKFQQGKDSVIATVAWMIIFGDGLHNFIDGLSIGAAFNESIWTGVSISVAVLCEELPHELGDFAVLLNAGMSMKQAVIYNFLSACTCYVGMAVGILLGEIEASVYIFALAGGMFLYISLVDMVPEMNEIAQETGKISVKKGMITLLLQNIGLFTGIFALYLLAKYQDSFQF